MKGRNNMIIATLAAFLLATVFASPGWGQSSYTIDVRTKGGIGIYLVDLNGITLYNSKKDSRDRSTCTGECAAMWPVFYSENMILGRGLKASDFGTITRDDGKKQTTYKGMPLYYFSDDKNPGDTNGDGVHHIWFAATPSVGSWRLP